MRVDDMIMTEVFADSIMREHISCRDSDSLGYCPSKNFP